MDLAERNRLIAITKGFQGLGGLCYAPMGVLNLALSLLHIGAAYPDSTPARNWAGLALFPCAIAACVAAVSYYRRRFGVVRSKCARGPIGVLLIMAGITGGLTLFAAAAYMDGALYPQPAASYPVSFTCLWWALIYLLFYLAPYRVRPHSLWFASLFLGLCILTLVDAVPKSQFVAGSGRAGDVLIWLCFSLHGLLDHLLLLRLLPKASLESSQQHV